MKKGKIFYAGFFVLAVIVCVTSMSYFRSSSAYRDLLQVVAVDVGQGSGMYIQTPTGVEIITDTGPSGQLLRSLSQYRGVFDRTIDYLIISHLDNDHMALAPRILEEYKVKNFAVTSDTSDNGLYKEVIRTLESARSQIHLPTAGDKYVIDNKIYLEYLWPEKGGSHSANRNDTSLVFRLVYEQVSFLFTGDISKSVEQQLVQKYGNQLQSDVLFIAHHGSKSSSDVRFLETVNPKYAVIQSGKENRYGHPHPDTIKAINSLGIPILRNDQLGNVLFISDGQTILVQ